MTIPKKARAKAPLNRPLGEMIQARRQLQEEIQARKFALGKLELDIMQELLDDGDTELLQVNWRKLDKMYLL